MSITTETGLKPTDEIEVIPSPPASRRRRGTAVLAGLVAAAAVATGVAVVATTSDPAPPAPAPAHTMSADAEARWQAGNGPTEVAPDGAAGTGSRGTDDSHCISATVTADAAERCMARR